jgi:chitodextrinase
MSKRVKWPAGWLPTSVTRVSEHVTWQVTWSPLEDSAVTNRAVASETVAEPGDGGANHANAVREPLPLAPGS